MDNMVYIQQQHSFQAIWHYNHYNTIILISMHNCLWTMNGATVIMHFHLHNERCDNIVR